MTLDLDFPLSEWRLIETPSEQGAWNMAIDEAILEAVGSREAPPTLRLYAWEPACLSLGYAQPIFDVDIPRLRERGWDLVRRPTGGRAILHTDELTYSVIGPQDDPRLTGGVLESYRRLSEALLVALETLNLAVQANPRADLESSENPPGPVCFEAPSNYEITINGKKLVGSAQARRRDGVLQHGTLPLWGDITRITQVLRFDSEGNREQAASRLLEHATTVESALGQRISWDAAARAFAEAFSQTLRLQLVPAALTPAETSRVEELVCGKYANQTWTEKT